MGNNCGCSSEDGVDLTEAHVRRRILSQIYHPVPSNVQVKTGYKENMSGHLLFYRCFIPMCDSPSVSSDEDDTKLDDSFVRTNSQNAPDIKGMICYCNGYGAHCEWGMFQTAMTWCQYGYIFFQYDHRGHGRSDGNFGFIDSAQALIDDCQYIFRFAKHQFGSMTDNFFVMGSSMGAAVILELSKSLNSEEWNGMIVASPMISIDNHRPSKAVEWMARNVIAPISPEFELWFAHSPTDADLKCLSRDSEIQDWIKENPCRYLKPIKVGTALSLLDLALAVAMNEFNDVSLPMLVLHGEGDTVCPISGSQLLMDKAMSKDKTLLRYDNAMHLLFLDICKQTVFDDCDGWMKKRCRGSTVRWRKHLWPQEYWSTFSLHNDGATRAITTDEVETSDVASLDVDELYHSNIIPLLLTENL